MSVPGVLAARFCDIQSFGKQIVNTATPFLEDYAPKMTSIAQNLVAGYYSVQQLKQAPISSFVQTTVSVASIAGTYFKHPAGIVISTVYDTYNESVELYQHLQAGEKAKALWSCLQILKNGLSLAVLMEYGIGFTIASTALQMILNFVLIQSKYQEGKNLEAAGQLVQALLNAKKLYSITTPLLQKQETKLIETQAPIEVASEEPKLIETQAAVEVASKEPNFLERRMIIEVGSGGTKVAIGDVDLRTNTVVKTILTDSHQVAYQAALEASKEGLFNSEIREKGITTFKTIQAKGEELGVQRTAVIATEAFRKATNTNDFVKEIFDKTGLAVQVLPQKGEALLGYYSSGTKGTVLDVGTGSYQLTMAANDSDIISAMGNMGSVPYKAKVYENVQDRPLEKKDLQEAQRLARQYMRESNTKAKKEAHAPIKDPLKDAIKKENGTIVGVGRLFVNSLAPLSESKEAITRDDLRKIVRSNLGKTRDQMKKESPFLDSDVSNAMFTLGVMQTMGIHKILPVAAATTLGALTYPDFWKQTTQKA